MKTLVMTMIMAMTAATNVFSNNSDNSDRPKFAYNCQVEDEQVTAQQVYRVTDSRLLSRHLEYRFAYDDQGRVIRKEALKWAEASQAYERYYCMEVSYLKSDSMNVLRPQSFQYKALAALADFASEHPQAIDSYTTRCDVLRRFMASK